MRRSLWLFLLVGYGVLFSISFRNTASHRYFEINTPQRAKNILRMGDEVSAKINGQFLRIKVAYLDEDGIAATDGTRIPYQDFNRLFVTRPVFIFVRIARAALGALAIPLLLPALIFKG